MNRRTAMLGAALAAGLLAGGLYYAGAQRTMVLVAARELAPTERIQQADLVERGFPADLIPDGALRDLGAALGRYLRAPLSAGQLVLGSSLADEAALFGSGLRPPTGMRAIAIPVTAATALGGALAPGHRVDVIAVPIAGKAPAARAVEVVVTRAVILDVRSDSGRALGGQPSRTAVAERLGSIVIAIAPSEELRVAERIAGSTFIVVLAP